MAKAEMRGVLFDKDGTLFDFEATWRGATRAMLDRLAPGDAERQAAMGVAVGFDPGTGRFAAGSPLVSGSVDDIARALSPLVPSMTAAVLETIGNAVATQMDAMELVPATSDLPGLLDDLRGAGFALGVATHDSEAAARAHLSAVGALSRFDFVCGYDSGHGLKPGPGMVLAFAARCGLAPSDIAMVGDSTHDLGAARAAGAGLAIGVLTGPATRADLAPLADIVLGSIAEVPEFLAGWTIGS